MYIDRVIFAPIDGELCVLNEQWRFMNKVQNEFEDLFWQPRQKIRSAAKFPRQNQLQRQGRNNSVLFGEFRQKYANNCAIQRTISHIQQRFEISYIPRYIFLE